MKKIVGITACVTGIAHTYLAEESLILAANTLEIDLKIETHGAIGIENALSKEAIDDAQVVIIASDIDIDVSRFIHKKIMYVKIQDAIIKPKEILLRALED